MGSRFTTTQPVLEANGKQTKAVVLFVYEGGGLEATSKIASIHWDSAQKYLLVLFVCKCTTQGSRRCKKDCLNDETYQPQFLAGLPLAQWGSLPHALFGSCPILLCWYYTSSQNLHIISLFYQVCCLLKSQQNSLQVSINYWNQSSQNSILHQRNQEHQQANDRWPEKEPNADMDPLFNCILVTSTVIDLWPLSGSLVDWWTQAPFWRRLRSRFFFWTKGFIVGSKKF